MLRSTQEEVPVMAATLPPLWKVWGRLTELEAFRKQRVREDLFSDAAEKLDAVEGPRGTLLCYGVNDQSRVWKF